MTTPFWSRKLAIREAQCIADAIRRHGQGVQVVIDEDEDDAPEACAAGTPPWPVSGWTQL